MKYPEAEAHLVNTDSVMGGLIELHYPIGPRSGRVDYFSSLSRSIIGQQISVKAANSIYERFVELTNLDPLKVIGLSSQQVKYIGLSSQKHRYLLDLVNHFLDNKNTLKHLEKLDDDQVIKELTKINGIGIWTAQMFLMFTLGRPDIFAPDDRGLQLAILKNYNLKISPKRNELINFAEKWQPFRTTASLYLWKSL